MSDLEPEKAIDVTPIEVKGQTYDVLRLREPRISEVKSASALMAKNMSIMAMQEYEVDLIRRVSGWPLEAVLQLPISKHNEAATYLGRFTEAGRAGSTSSPES